MKKPIRLKALSIILAVILCILPAASIYSYNYYGVPGYKMISGVTGRYWTYYNPSGYSPGSSVGTSYFNLSVQSMESWNITYTCSFTYLDYNNSTSSKQIYIVIGDYGFNQWRGQTQFYDSNDNLMNTDDPLTDDWKYAFCRMNHTYLSGVSTADELKSSITHEIGHALGLNHSDVTQSLMYDNISVRYGKYKIYTPQSDDISGMNDLYNDFNLEDL